MTLIPFFHKHLVLQTVQRMSLNAMEVVLKEELMIANMAESERENLISHKERIDLHSFGRSAKIIEVQ